MSLPYSIQCLLMLLGILPHQSYLLKRAKSLYINTVCQARRKEFYLDEGVVPDNYQGRLEMLWLHLFLLYERLRQESNDNGNNDIIIIGEFIAEIAVKDLEQNLRYMGVSDIAIGRRVQKLTCHQYTRLAKYHRLFIHNTVDINNEAFRLELLSYLYFNKNIDKQSQHSINIVMLLYRYIVSSIVRLRRQDINSVLIKPDYSNPANYFYLKR